MISLVSDELEAYAVAHTTSAGARMDALAEETRATLANPQMLSGPVEGAFLATLIFATGASSVLEIGTYSGYSALSMAAALPPGGCIVTCELSEENAAFARRHFEGSEFGDRIDLRVGPALATIAGLDGPFDLVFIDADKTGYAAYYEATLAKLAPRGLIAVDNTLWSGRVLAPDSDPSDPDESTSALVAFNDMVVADERVNVTVLTIRDGITLIRRRA